MNDIKPCPFCGCKKVYIFTHNFITDNHEYSVEVVKCDFCGGQYRAPSGQRKFAIERWNKRVLENEEH